MSKEARAAFEKMFPKIQAVSEAGKRTPSYLAFLTGWTMRDEKIIDDREIPLLSFQRIGYGGQVGAEITFEPGVHWTPLLACFARYGSLADDTRRTSFVNGYRVGLSSKLKSEPVNGFGVGQFRGNLAAAGRHPWFDTDIGVNETDWQYTVHAVDGTDRAEFRQINEPPPTSTPPLPNYSPARQLAHSIVEQAFLTKAQGGSAQTLKILCDTIYSVIMSE